jgi:hypothetical protein
MIENRPASSGAGLKRTGIGVILLGGVLYAVLGGPDDDPAGLFGALFMPFGVLLYFRGRQHAAKALAASLNSPIRDARPDVLYLRTFRTDVSTAGKILASGLSTEEEQLADVLRPFGNMVAIGHPGESLPTPGAARIYAKDSEWKGVVLDRMRSAPLVVIRAGGGPGLVWEVGQALTTLSPEKVLFLILNMTMSEYSAFADQVRDSFQLVLPAIGPYGLLRTVIDYRENPSKVTAGFISFSADWTPLFIPLPSTLVRVGYNDLRQSFNLALRPVFDRHKVAWRPLGRFQ